MPGQTTKNSVYQLGWAILAECSRPDIKTFQGCVILFCGFCARQKLQVRNALIIIEKSLARYPKTQFSFYEAKIQILQTLPVT